MPNAMTSAADGPANVNALSVAVPFTTTTSSAVDSPCGKLVYENVTASHVIVIAARWALATGTTASAASAVARTTRSRFIPLLPFDSV
jgi:hypothetical protein